MSSSCISAPRLAFALLSAALFASAQKFTPLVEKKFAYPSGIVSTLGSPDKHSIF
jgi:hypothetical protein